MSARIYIRQNGITYRFLRIEQHQDGSIYITVVRKAERQADAMLWNNQERRFIPNPDATIGERRVSYHVSGRVNYRPLVSSPPLFFDPLFDVNQQNHFLLISIPQVSRLDVTEVEPKEDAQIPEAIIELDANVAGRVTFGLGVTSLQDDFLAAPPIMRLGYDTFALFLYREALPVPVSDEIARHFIYAAPKGLYQRQFCGRFEAELAYHQKRAGPGIIIYGPDARGVYTLYPKVEMRVTPKATFHFSDPSLGAEVVDGSWPHKIRFRVRGKGGYVTGRDLRPLIEHIELDADN